MTGSPGMTNRAIVLWSLGLTLPVQYVWTLGHTYPFHLAAWARLLMTYGSVAAAALLVSSVLTALPRARVLLILAVALAVTGTAALVGSGLYIDRYCLDSTWSLVIALVLIVRWEKPAARNIAISVLAATAIFGTLSVQEYFAWNRARWTAYHALRARGIPLAQIDGGSEATCWYEIAHMTRDQARTKGRS